MKTVMKVFFVLSVMMLFAVSANAAFDFKTIYDRMFNEYLQNPSAKTIDKAIDVLQDDGRFGNIDYTTTSGKPRTHLNNIYQLASAYVNPKNQYYNDTFIRDLYIAGLKFWIKTDHRPSNWWYRSIAYPKEFAKGVILMSEEIKKDKQLLEDVVKYLYYDFENRKIEDLYTEGANGADIVISVVAAAVLIEDDERMMQLKDVMTHLLEIQPLRGILKDYQFAQHCGHGRQIYTLSYGREFVKSMISYIEFCNGTKYQTGNLNIFQDFFVNAVQWLFYSGAFDPNTMGRKISSTYQINSWVESAERLSKIEGLDGRQMAEISKRLAGKNSLEGNRMFWRVDYMSHHGKGFMASSRMTSSRTVGNEAGNGEGMSNYYSSNGVNYIFVTGKEYDRDYFTDFNSRQFPGITAEQDTCKVPAPEWGEFGSNGNGFAGGASDGKFGACGMILDRRNLKAHKSWFYFNNEFVCLGSGISMSNGTGPVYTTLNQCNIDGDIRWYDGKNINKLTSDVKTESMKWLLHGKTGYIDLSQKSAFHITSGKSIMALNINHGVNPSGASYAYVVKPAVSSEKELKKYAESVTSTVKVVSNTEKTQSVYNSEDRIWSIVFYEKGMISYDGMKVETDTPCVVVWNIKNNTLSVANPYCEQKEIKNITLKVENNGNANSVVFDLPQAEESGKSVTKQL